MIKEVDEILSSDSGYVSYSSYNLVYIFRRTSGILKLFEGNFHQGIKLHIMYFTLTDINVTAVIILFSIHLPSIHRYKSSSDEAQWYF